MKTHTFVLCFLIGAMASSVARASEVKECWLEEKDKHGVSCRVRLVENDSVSNPGATTPSPSDCEKVKLYVDCNCDFKLSDEYATQFDKGRDEFNVGSEQDKLAVLVIKNEALTANNHGQKAVLTISSRNHHGTFARRLVGECNNKKD